MMLEKVIKLQLGFLSEHPTLEPSHHAVLGSHMKWPHTGVTGIAPWRFQTIAIFNSVLDSKVSKSSDGSSIQPLSHPS